MNQITNRSVFAGKYEVTEEMGRDSMRVIYKSDDTKLKSTGWIEKGDVPFLF